MSNDPVEAHPLQSGDEQRGDWSLRLLRKHKGSPATWTHLVGDDINVETLTRNGS
jgi:hypothetical protein